MWEICMYREMHVGRCYVCMYGWMVGGGVIGDVVWKDRYISCGGEMYIA